MPVRTARIGMRFRCFTGQLRFVSSTELPKILKASMVDAYVFVQLRRMSILCYYHIFEVYQNPCVLVFSLSDNGAFAFSLIWIAFVVMPVWNLFLNSNHL
ncbi:hypothetical protein ACP275_05G086700 [Erythranthe tilingii]